MKQNIMMCTSLCALTLTSCAPRASYVTPVGAFSTQTAKLSESVTSELARFTTERRAIYLREDLFQRIRTGMAGSAATSKARSMEHFLCTPRTVASSYAANSAYLGAITTGLKSASGDPEKKTGQLLVALFDNYDIKVPPAPARENDARCAVDVAGFADVAYPSGQTEFAPGAAIAGAEALYAVFDKLANAVLQQIDDARRASALRDYFSDTEKVAQLKATIAANGKFLEDASATRRALDVAVLQRAYLAFEKSYAQIDLTKVAACKAMLANPPQDVLNKNAAFQACYDEIATSMQKDFAALLNAAAAYDKDATAQPGLAAEELSKTVDKLVDVATNKNVTPQQFAQMIESLVNAASAISTLVDKVDDEDTKKAIDEALAKFKTG